MELFSKITDVAAQQQNSPPPGTCCVRKKMGSIQRSTPTAPPHAAAGLPKSNCKLN